MSRPIAMNAGHRSRGWIRAAAWLVLVALCLIPAMGAGPAFAQTSQPRTVSFPSADGKTMLVGYLFAPAGRPKTAPAVVLLHGRSGTYSPQARGNYAAVTIDKRIRSWAETWSAQGYWALVVDSFGPRGYPAGFASSDAAPAAVNDLAVRPLDAYGALRYLRASPRVKGDRVALFGWSDGATATLASMERAALNVAEAQPGKGFRTAIALYPACDLDGRLRGDAYAPYAPVHIFIGSRDQNTSPAACEKLAATTRASGGDLAVTLLPGASHDFDNAARERQQLSADASATERTRRQAETLLTSAFR